MFGSPSTTDSLEILTRRATQCALNIQTTLAKYDSNQGFTLTLHVGIGAGTIYALYVGGIESSWEFLVTGEPLAQLRTCVDLSSAGEVCVSSTVWDLISDYFDGELISSSENNDYLVHRVNGEEATATALPKLIPKSPAFAEVARCFIPKAVQVQIDSNQTQWMDELRVVTVLFVKLNSEIPCESMDIFCKHLHNYLVIMQTEIFRFDGMVRQFLADDKGTVLIAAFGVPPSSHLDGGLRAVRAAIAIHTKLKEVGMENSIGITTGAVFCGAVGSVNRREYAMVGDTVNLSARLMVAAGKMDYEMNILCDKTTSEACKGKQILTALPPIYVKGKSLPIPIFIPATKPADDRRAIWKKHSSELTLKLCRSCVGRDNEISAIQNQLRAIAAREAKSLVVIAEGETGTGKTILASLMQFKAKRSGFNTFLSSGDSIATSNPFFVWRHILENILSSSKLNKSKLQMFQAAKTLCGPQHEEYLPLLVQVIPSLEVPPEYANLATKMNAQQKQLRLTQMIAHIVINYSKGVPLCIILDDLQWVDIASLQLVSYLLPICDQLFFLCSMRPFEDRGSRQYLEIQKLLQGDQTTLIKLAPFETQQVCTLVREMLSVREVPKEFLELLQAGQGNPMYITEIVYHLLTTKAIVIEDHQIILQTKIQDIKLPHTLHDIVAGRFDKFSQTVQLLLKVGSVIGLEFPVELLQRIYNSSMDVRIRSYQIISELQTACSADFIHQDSRNARVFAFNNSYLQQVAYSRLLFSQRIKLHREVANHYETLINPNSEFLDVGVVYPILHHHWEAILSSSIEGENNQVALYKTILYLKSTGEHASQLGDNGAVSFFSAALEKTALIIDKQERLRRQKELKLKIVGANRINAANINLSSIKHR